MFRISFWFRLVCIALPVVALPLTVSPAHAAAAIDCKAARPPAIDSKTFIDTCRAQAATSRANARLAAAGATVYDSRTTVAGLNFANVPTWTDADILAQFPLQRDARYLTDAVNTGLQRRLSWLYPDDGCFARAEQFDVRVAQAGKTRPAKLFAFSQSPGLRVYTPNAPNGVVQWWYHVVPVVKNSAGEPIVFDAAISPCKPLPWKKWLEAMIDNVADFDNIQAGNGVSLGDSWSYVPFNLVSGEVSHSAESVSDLSNFYLPAEWDRQVELGRDPNVVLGATPPWSGYSCVDTESVDATGTMAANGSQTVTATCPIGTLAVGGGLGIDMSGVTVSKSAKSGNGWQVTAKNTTSSSRGLYVSAICLTGAPLNASVTTATGSTVNVAPNATGTSTATCATGTLVGGGYTTTQGSTSTMRIFNNSRSSSTGSSWKASALNNTFTAKDVTAYGYCLANTGLTFSQTSVAFSGGGLAFFGCQGKATGGGYTFPQNGAYTVNQMYPFSNQFMVVTVTPGPGGTGDPNAKAHAECVAHP
jgi:Glutaminase